MTMNLNIVLHFPDKLVVEHHFPDGVPSIAAMLATTEAHIGAALDAKSASLTATLSGLHDQIAALQDSVASTPAILAKIAAERARIDAIDNPSRPKP